MTFKPYSKEQSVGVKSKGIMYKCSDGTKLSEAQIKTRTSKEYKHTPFSEICQCCGSEKATEHDHTISKARCKTLHKTELTWDSNNWSDSCRTCHGQWESYKSGEFADHLNFIERMKFIKTNDLEGFNKRMGCVDRVLLDALRPL